MTVIEAVMGDVGCYLQIIEWIGNARACRLHMLWIRKAGFYQGLM